MGRRKINAVDRIMNEEIFQCSECGTSITEFEVKLKKYNRKKLCADCQNQELQDGLDEFEKYYEEEEESYK